MPERLKFVVFAHKCAYFSCFSSFAVSMRCSAGTVNSNTVTFLFVFFSFMTISGFRVVTTTLGGTVPPAGA